MSAATVLVDVADGVATLTLHAPEKRNAFDAATGRELAAAYARCDADDEVRAVVLTGTPPAFCAGADLSGGEGTFAGTDVGFSAAGVRFPAFAVRKPVVAAVNGHALGIGLTLALQCDVRFLAADARYGVVQARLGVLGDAWSHWVLPRMIGVSRAAEVLLSGATFDGHRALELGLGSRVLAADEVLPAAQEWAREVAVHTAPQSVAASKQLLWSSFDLDAAEVERLETAWHRRLMAHDDVREGGRAVKERRAPRWTGRVSDLPPAPSPMSPSAG
ncbi:enoyl-CoA hydratase-related protein [Nocardioides sp. zg-DK7169]|uniref:enoyl-CoA hydratase-related protein n=1 Tax=Nocardioides sp. zg-DK7169 TaxID=2736600 RepID=UPI001552D7B8|nr:crotonase [Nocardioides sp. zg-DK7169]